MNENAGNTLDIIENMNEDSTQQFMLGNSKLLTNKNVNNKYKVGIHSGEAPIKSKTESLFDGSSSTAHTSSSMDSAVIAFTKIVSINDSNKMPSTLKFLVQNILLVFILVTVTSVVALSLTFFNFNDAIFGINVIQLALARVNSLRSVRPIMRNLVNIANDLSPNSNEIIQDRFTYYSNIVDHHVENMREI